MSITRTLGGDRLGAGKKNFVTMRNYDRSTHDLSYVWRSTMAPGTLVPFMNEVALPGDTFDIDLNCDIMTHPTVGPLFGSYKVQLDVFLCPVRLYQGQLHNNKLGIGNNMSDVKLPLLQFEGAKIDNSKGADNQHTNPSCILAYLGIRGAGRTNEDNTVRYFNAIPLLSYWDIYKNYYANKQEEIGAVIHNEVEETPQSITEMRIRDAVDVEELPEAPATIGFDPDPPLINISLAIDYNGMIGVPDLDQVIIKLDTGDFAVTEIFNQIIVSPTIIDCIDPRFNGVYINWRYANPNDLPGGTPQVYTFPLDNIDEMRETILADVANTGNFVIDNTGIEPYSLPLKWTGTGTGRRYSKLTSLEGLGLKTYQSDLFNNWIQTEWIDGTNGISDVTAISTAGGSFTIDTLNLSKKVYDMLNRIALSGGSYKDWIDTVYTETDSWIAETPMYMGGLIKELVFQEVISNSQSEAQPLGTLGGRGVMAKKHKGGKITVKVKEPSFIMGIISLTPRIDYSQGNDWYTGLYTMDDFHKPALDEIGFQDLITDQMAWWDTNIGNGPNYSRGFRSAGKQPAWINYMTNVNKTYGNFAIEDNEMFMTLNRKYELVDNQLADLTTYIDPIKFNDIFAETARDAQNFWTQIGVGITARRVMSAKLIPNL